MRYSHLWTVLLLAVASSVLAACGQEDTPAASCGDLQVESAWVVPAHSGSREMLGYFTLENKGGQPVEIKGISSGNFDRAVFQDRRDTEDAGPKPLAPFTIKAGERIEFEPGKREAVLYSPTHAYQEGDEVQMRLTCGKDDDTLDIKAQVRDQKGDLPADDEQASDREQVIQDSQEGGGKSAVDDSRAAH